MSAKDTRKDDRKVWSWGDRNRDGEEKDKDKELSASSQRNRDHQQSEMERDVDGRDKNRQRLNDRDRNRDDRRRPRDRDRDRGDRNDAIQGPIVLLRRPAPPPALAATTKSSSSLPVNSSRESDKKDYPLLDKKQSDSGGRVEKELKIQSARCNDRGETVPVPVVLLRPTTTITASAKQNIADNIHKDTEKKEVTETTTAKIEKPKPLCAAEIALNALKPYRFPEKFALPIIDSSMKIQALNSLNFFNERGKLIGDYFIVTVVGKPLSGKSTILSYLAGRPVDPRRKKFRIFPKRTRSDQLDSFLYITPDNVIFMEMASLFNCAAAADLASHQGTLENTSLTWNLKLMRWALAVSHVVLVVCDGVLDPNLCQLISSAEMIHPLESALGEGVYPEITFVCNNVSQSNLNDGKLRKQYNFMIHTVVGGTPRIQPNLFMLPEGNLQHHVHRLEALKSALFTFVRYNRAPHLPEVEFTKTPIKYNAHDWHSNITKIWEAMQHPNYFASYLKLFP